MPHPHRLLALLLAVLYVSVSTFGAAFVVCFEADGSRNVETLGADCCAVEARHAGADGEVALTTTDDDGCDDCQDHLPAVDLEPMKLDVARSPLPATVTHPPPTLPASLAISPPALGEAAFGPAPPHPPPSGAAACLRTIVLRC